MRGARATRVCMITGADAQFRTIARSVSMYGVTSLGCAEHREAVASGAGLRRTFCGQHGAARLGRGRLAGGCVGRWRFIDPSTAKNRYNAQAGLWFRGRQDLDGGRRPAQGIACRAAGTRAKEVDKHSRVVRAAGEDGCSTH